MSKILISYKYLYLVFVLHLLFSSCSPSIKNDPSLVPEEIEYDGKPGVEYQINGKIIGLDQYLENDPDGSYLRMKFKGQEISLKFLDAQSDTLKQVFSGSGYQVTFLTEKYGACAGEGQQYITGKASLEHEGKMNSLAFEGSTSYCADPACKEIGNGLPY